MKIHQRFLVLLAFLGWWSAAANADILFTDISTPAGLTHSIYGEGACVLDFDGDGWEDIFIAGFNGRNLLYRNQGDMTFLETAEAAGVDSTGRARLPIVADFDGDGYVDLLVACYEDPAHLFRNNGDGTFSDVTTESGINNTGIAGGGAWFDYNRDGWLDAYVGNLLTPNTLCRNNGDGTFSEVAGSINAGGPMPDRLVMGLAILDYDRDGDEDIFMAQDGNRGNVLLRREPSGTFADVSLAAGVVVPVQGMGVAVGDYDRDGYFDVYTTNLDESTLFHNNGDGTFEDVTIAAGVGDLPEHMGWGTFFFDADNDGLLDLYNNNQTGFGQVPNSFFHNLGDGTFEDLSLSSGLQCWNDGIGSAYGDFDNDGDLDIVLAGQPSPAGNVKLFRNDSNEPNNWIQLTLRGEGTNYQAVGTTIEAYTATGIQTAMVSAGNGYASQNTLRQHFGVGTLTSIDSVVVYWPNGSRERFENLLLNAHHIILQGTGTTGVTDNHGRIPVSFQLYQNSPNPFNPSTTIRYTLSRDAHVTLKVYNMLGQFVVTLVDGIQSAGDRQVVWDGMDGGDREVASGMYVYELRAGEHAAARRMLLIR